MLREKLSRKSRGPGTARLCLERHVEDGLKRKVHQQLAEALTTTMTTPDDSSTTGPSPMYSSIVDDLLTEMAVEPVVAPNGVPVYRVERGGEVTCHVPSQLVVYPIFDLRRPPFKDDLRWYWTTLEQVVIDTLKEYGIEGTRDEINTGVWVGQDKVAAIGIAASRWITHHGFALNVDPELSYFDTKFILPCGIEGRGVTSMAAILRGQYEPVPSLHEVADVVLEQMKKHFDIHIELG
jgi:lipoate-protein ligase B